MSFNDRKRVKEMRLFFAILCTALFLIVGICHIVMEYNFDNTVGDYLKLAGDAPSVERANEFLTNAIDGIERRGITKGNSAYIFKTPDADVGIWYSQITGAKETLTSILNRVKADSSSVTQLERDNALMKIREVLLDQSQSGTTVTLPPHIAIYPQHWTMFIFYVIFAILAIVCWIAFAAEY